MLLIIKEKRNKKYGCEKFRLLRIQKDVTDDINESKQQNLTDEYLNFRIYRFYYTKIH